MLPGPRRASLILFAGLAAALAACSPPAPQKNTPAPAGIVNVYSGRHYDADKAVFRAFTEETGIDVRAIEADGAQLLERLKAEGEFTNADVIMTVDAGNLARLVEAGLLAPLSSPAVEAVPARYRDPQGRWVAFARRARVIIYQKGAVDPATLTSMDDLVKPDWRGAICVRTGANLYNLSLMAARIERDGPERAQAWAKGMVANFARQPQGSDTDQLRAVAAGDCKIAIVNHYYLARMQGSDDPADRAVAEKVGIVFPDQAGAGAHVNISGAGVSVHARNRDNAQKLVEYMTTAKAQQIIADMNDELPVADGVALPAPLAAMAGFKEEDVAFDAIGARQGEAQRLFETAGWR
ncbi:MAG: extracellular solute-binding protein [Hyphomonadaceae bacterium]|nr:extracellular solute-binding protein [Hyphomonadaceae bacterium]